MNNELKLLKIQIVRDFCDAMEFKAFTSLAYLLAAKHATQYETSSSVTLGYSEFANSIGLTNKSIQFQELPSHFNHVGKEHFLSLVHQSQVALFEHNFFKIIRLILTHQPLCLNKKKQIEYSVIFNAQTKEEIIFQLIEREVNEIKYKSVEEWFEYLERIVAECKLEKSEVGKIAEAKASRDLLVHNAGTVNSIYLNKAGDFARFKLGEICSVADNYTLEVWQSLISILMKIVDILIKKFP